MRTPVAAGAPLLHRIQAYLDRRGRRPRCGVVFRPVLASGWDCHELGSERASHGSDATLLSWSRGTPPAPAPMLSFTLPMTRGRSLQLVRAAHSCRVSMHELHATPDARVGEAARSVLGRVRRLNFACRIPVSDLFERFSWPFSCVCCVRLASFRSDGACRKRLAWFRSDGACRKSRINLPVKMKEALKPSCHAPFHHNVERWQSLGVPSSDGPLLVAAVIPSEVSSTLPVQCCVQTGQRWLLAEHASPVWSTAGELDARCTVCRRSGVGHRRSAQHLRLGGRCNALGWRRSHGV
jgi:hypothetical protein